MIVFAVDPDRQRTAQLRSALQSLGCTVAFAHDFASAGKLLLGPARPGVLYVAEIVPPLSGADLLSMVERHERLAGVPIVAHVSDDRSLLAAALRRGGVRLVNDAVGADALATLLAALASSSSDADWRVTMIAWARCLRLRTDHNREVTASRRATARVQFRRATELVRGAGALRASRRPHS